MKDLQNDLLASVLICTRNRSEYLGNSIRKAAVQELSYGNFEIIVVDNGSTDHTPEVVQECQATIRKTSFHYVVETDVGLSVARNRAMREANGRIFCFLDDDAVPEPEWLEWLIRGYVDDPRVMSVGGEVVPVYETALPAWFPESLEFIFRPQIHDAVLHQVAYPYYPYGANFSIRAEAVRHIGEFNASLGYKGADLIPCEETDFLLRLERAGFKVLMEPRAVVKHIIPANRLTHNYLRRRQYSYGRGCALMDYLNHSVHAYKKVTINMVIKIVLLLLNNAELRIRLWNQLAHDRQPTRSSAFLHLCQLSEYLGYSDQELRILMNLLWHGTKQTAKS